MKIEILWTVFILVVGSPENETAYHNAHALAANKIFISINALRPQVKGH